MPCMKNREEKVKNSNNAFQRVSVSRLAKFAQRREMKGRVFSSLKLALTSGEAGERRPAFPTQPKTNNL